MYFSNAYFSVLIAALAANRPCFSQSVRGGGKNDEAASFEKLMLRREQAVPRACSAHAQCSDLQGDCCPVTNADGSETFLSCCNVQDSCTSNPACAALGLRGDCCPSQGGFNLDCCDKPTASPTTAPTASPSEAPTRAKPTASPTSGPTPAPTCASSGPAGSNPIFVEYNRKCGGDRKFRTLDNQPLTLQECNQKCFETVGCAYFSLGEDATLLPNNFVGVCIGCPDSEPSVPHNGFNSYKVDPCTIPATESPTGSPTASPTASPSSSPTTSPTKSPSASPTTSPTAFPSSSPTASPTASPSSSPTTSPTSSPTTSPTVSPTSSPTKTPTASPTSSPVTPSPTVVATKCDAYPVCKGLGLTGDCCPTDEGVELTCCNPPPQCSANSGCAGLSGNCCPNDQGDFLACCAEPTPPSPPVATSCSAYPVCAGLGLTGECCPTTEGKFLDCCDPPKQCNKNPACSDLVGNCCPTNAGVFLDCCSENPPTLAPVPGPAPESCAAHSQCNGLAGNCCPTPAGKFLNCCDP